MAKKLSNKTLKLLVANRSEIACRVFQACREMGIRTVGLLAPGDEEARHLTFADEVASVKSYLDIASVTEAAQATKADLVHPGYGFLSERPEFATSIEKAGIQFLGPRAETMRLLGGKIASKELAQKLKVPTLPWAKVKDSSEWHKVAKKTGYPLLLKASAGGGGKGMRRVDRPQDLDGAAESASAEALSAFGDGTLFLERLCENPRHIEVQVFGDGKGGAVHLFERECSLQRRHQKVWEEAPAERLPEKTRKGLHQAALKLVRATKYRSAGTVEFLVDSKGGFYFLEMNTRLQVEHPVTELVTGVDLVRAQIELALTGQMPEVHPPRGHAIEVRLYAEDPSQGFMPCPGKILKIHWPTGPGIRVDSGIEEGQSITTLFDSMLAKLIVWGVNRKHAIDRLKVALEETAVLGIGNNQSYLLELCAHPAVREGKVDTGFLGRELGTFAPQLDKAQLTLIADLRSPTPTPSLGTEPHPSPWFSLAQTWNKNIGSDPQ